MNGDGLMWLGVAVLMPTAAGYAAVAVRRLLRRLESRRAPVVPPRPIERLAADLRRLHALVEDTENAVGLPAKNLRCQAARGAYLDALVAACRQLDVPPPEGRPVARTEIYRVESDLRRQGLDVRVAG